MQDSLKAQLTLSYKRFQWYMDNIDNSQLDGLDDKFIEAYDKADIKACKVALSLLSDKLNSL